MIFTDRKEAGQRLANKLAVYANAGDVLVLALPRGGVPVAYEVARRLKAPLDIFMVRKLGAPDQKELAIGAIATGGIMVLNSDIVQSLRLTQKDIDLVIAEEQQELERREKAYRDGRPTPEIAGKTVILVDDGLATGATMRAAVLALHEYKPARLVIAVPVAAETTFKLFENKVDAIVCAVTPTPFYSIGMWYDDFSQITDEEVRELLQKTTVPKVW